MTYSYQPSERYVSHHTALEKLPVGAFTLTFEKCSNYVLARLSQAEGLEIRITAKRPHAERFVIATSSSFRFCEEGVDGLFSEDYMEDNPVRGRWMELFSRLISQEKGGRKLYESRFMVLKKNT